MNFGPWYRGSVGGVLWVAGVLIAGPSIAAEEKENAVETITVTAQKQEQDIQTVPISVKVITDETLEQINADGLKDIVRLVPSLSMTDLSRGGNNVQIRGLGSNVASVGTVALYNDGVISVNRTPSSGTFSEQDSALYDVNRVEVLRGPQGTLWGEGSFGGVINVISNAPNAEEMQASLSTSAFDIDHGTNDNHDAAGMINIPLMKDTLALRIVGFDYDHDGYIDAVDPTPVFSGLAPNVSKDANTERVTGGRALLRFTPGESMDATLIYKTQTTEIGIQSYDSPNAMANLNAAFGISLPTDLTQLVGERFGSKDTTDEGILDVNIKTGIGTVTSVSGYGTVDQKNENSVKSNSDGWSEELRLASDNSGAINWLVGGYYRTVERDIDAFGASFARDAVDQWAVFGQTYWTFAPKWTATLGLRYGQYEEKVTDKEPGGRPPVSNSFNNLSPKFALDWQIDDVTLAYATIAQGFRAGGANIDESLGNDPRYIQSFDDDTIWNYEIGLKAGLWDNLITVNTALFYIDWSDIQIDRAIQSFIAPPLQFVVTNGDDAHSFGIETDVYIYPGDGWTVVLGGSWLQAQYDGGTIDTDTATDVSINGDTLPNAPEYLVNASVEKRFAMGEGVEGFVRADYSMRGSSYADVPNTPPSGGNFESGRYNLFNLRAGVQGDFWAIQVFATNLFDQNASSFDFFDGGFGEVHVMLQPRTFGINLKLNYH